MTFDRPINLYFFVTIKFHTMNANASIFLFWNWIKWVIFPKQFCSFFSFVRNVFFWHSHKKKLPNRWTLSGKGETRLCCFKFLWMASTPFKGYVNITISLYILHFFYHVPDLRKKQGRDSNPHLGIFNRVPYRTYLSVRLPIPPPCATKIEIILLKIIFNL